jgi:hypothetical protein
MEVRLDDGKFVLIPRHILDGIIVAHENKEPCGHLLWDILVVGLHSFGGDVPISDGRSFDSRSVDHLVRDLCLSCTDIAGSLLRSPFAVIEVKVDRKSFRRKSTPS